LKALPHGENLEVVQLDVRKPEQLAAFLQGCDLVVHGGTPFQLDVKDPQAELFEPTVKGTENFLEAIQRVPSIRKVVIIASVAAYNSDFPMLPKDRNAGDQVSEADAPYFNPQSIPYAQAKYVANMAVNDFIAANPGLSFEITSVSPTGVMGMALSQRGDSTSMGLQYLIKNRIAPNPFIQMIYDNDIEWSMVDVADVAEAVFKAAITVGLHGRNYLLASESYRVSDIHVMLNGSAPVNAPTIVYNSALAQKELGVRFRSARETLQSYAEAMVSAQPA